MKRNYTKSYKSHVYPCVSSLLAPSGFYFSLILILKAKYGRNEKLSIANHLRTWPLSNDARRCPAVGSVLRSPCGAQNPQHWGNNAGKGSPCSSHFLTPSSTVYICVSSQLSDLVSDEHLLKGHLPSADMRCGCRSTGQR